jgi:hypothetical protein
MVHFSLSVNDRCGAAQHIFVPVLPRSLLTYCCAPMPFLVGVHSAFMSEVNQLPLEQVPPNPYLIL